MLDEPFTALDAESDRGVKTALKKIVADAQIPCIVVTHRHADVIEIADRVCVICKGKLAWEGPVVDMPEDVGACRCGPEPGRTTGLPLIFMPGLKSCFASISSCSVTLIYGYECDPLYQERTGDLQTPRDADKPADRRFDREVCR